MLDHDVLGVKVQVSEEEIKDDSEMVESWSAKDVVKLIACRKTFHWIPSKTFLQVAQDELKSGSLIWCDLPQLNSHCIAARRFVRV